MKKLLIAAAAMTAVAGVAQAQSSVTIYGAIGGSSNSYQRGGVDVPTQYQNASRDHLYTTNLGFTGTEDLGGGMSAFFRLEGDLSGSGVLGAATDTTSQTNIFNRHAHVGLTTKFGTLTVGRQNDSVKDTEGLAQVYNLSDNLMNNTIVGDRIANAYKYATPTWNGLSATYTYSNNPADAVATAADGSVTHNSFAINYKLPVNGGVDLAYAHGKERDVAANDKKTTRFSARTTVMGATVGAAYTQNEQGANELNQTLVSVSVPFGNFEAKAHYVNNSQKGSVIGTQSTTASGQNGGDGYGVMAVYNFSKRTSAYVGYSDFSADTSSLDLKVTTVGLVHKF